MPGAAAETEELAREADEAQARLQHDDKRTGRSNVYWVHSAVPRWSHQVNRGIEWSSDEFGTRPSATARTVSFSQQWEADTFNG